jgi:hypothetical protein
MALDIDEMAQRTLPGRSFLILFIFLQHTPLLLILAVYKYSSLTSLHLESRYFIQCQNLVNNLCVLCFEMLAVV